MFSSDIGLVILDFDGVLTDNRVYVMEDGREAVACHRGDGWGIGILGQAGIEVMILSTESNPVVSARATKLGIECLQGCDDKASATSGIINRKKVGFPVPIENIFSYNKLNGTAMDKWLVFNLSEINKIYN